jgi:DNA-binding Lrp family transcriptional regulator
MNNKIDSTDKALIAALVEDSSLPSRELARRISVHPNTLLQRLKRLEKKEIIVKYTAVVDYDKIGFGLQALIFMTVDMSKEWEKMLRPVSKLPEISAFILLTGDYDCVAIVRVRDKEELADVLRKIQGTGVVTKTTSHLILDYYKQNHEYNPLKV